jgi:hypothetical protein
MTCTNTHSIVRVPKSVANLTDLDDARPPPYHSSSDISRGEACCAMQTCEDTFSSMVTQDVYLEVKTCNLFEM